MNVKNKTRFWELQQLVQTPKISEILKIGLAADDN